MRLSGQSVWVALMAGFMLISPVHAETQTETAQQQVIEAIASDHVQSVIAALPILEQIWPQSMGEYFGSAEQIARFFNDAVDDPAVQQAVEKLYTAVLNKRCPEDADMVQATAYFDCKEKVVRYSGQFESMRYNKPHLLAVSIFLGEIRDWRIPDYQIQIKRMPGREILEEAGVPDASSLTNPVLVQAYEKAIADNQRDKDMNRLQLALSGADSSITFKLLTTCKQLRHDGKLDDDFADEVAENGHLTEKEREMKFTFDDDSGWGS